MRLKPTAAIPIMTATVTTVRRTAVPAEWKAGEVGLREQRREEAFQRPQ
jgi:hypothetical protein